MRPEEEIPMFAFHNGPVGLSFVTAALLTTAPAFAQSAPGGAPASTSSQAAAAPAAATPPTDAATPAEKPAKDAGNHPAPNSVYAEGLGAGIVYSINYERMVIDDVAVRAGFGYLSVGASASGGGATASSNATFLMFPITASYTGIRTHGGTGLELGGGSTLLYTSGSASALGTASSGAGITPTIVAMVGLRIHPVDHAGFNFRVGAMALGGQGLALSNADPTKFGFIPWGYLSLGASF
jgi:hypothetical protein